MKPSFPSPLSGLSYKILDGDSVGDTIKLASNFTKRAREKSDELRIKVVIKCVQEKFTAMSVSELMSCFRQAVKDENFPKVNALLSYGKIKEKKDEQGATVFHIAASDGDLSFFQFFTKNGISLTLNQQDRLGKTPMHYAVEKGVINIRKKVLQSREDFSSLSLLGARAVEKTQILFLKIIIYCNGNLRRVDNFLKVPKDYADGKVKEFLEQCEQ